ncbi:MAG TPA: hypothetical protein VEJ87_04020 [Acidimicrobiales bacterium]|nr:hypothetical protein [Acidimicrobiales bacterium]
MTFRPQEIETFRITDFDFDPSDGRAVFRYALDDVARFEEVIDFGRRAHLSASEQRGFEACLRLLHLTAGVSYYKAAAPPRLVVESGTLDALEADFVNELYDRGLREFAYRNGLGVPLRFELCAKFESGSRSENSSAPAPGLAVPVGGGKDSIVVAEALRELRPLLVSVNGHPASRRIAEIAGLELAVIGRKVAPELLALNRSGALNGHVPVTAIVSLIVVASGYLYGFSTTAMSLEGSSSFPTRSIPQPPTSGVTSDSEDSARSDRVPVEINHQWSKSIEFEQILQQLLTSSVHPGIRYVSLLRGFSDLEIADCFATLTQYHRAFRSCNKAFAMSSDFDDWCCECPKCRFVFLTLATTTGREELISVFGSDLLSDADQVEGFVDLVHEDRKPFECVGTSDESLAAIRRLVEDPNWSGSIVVQKLAQILSTELASVPRKDSAAPPGEVLTRIREELEAQQLV